MVVIQKFAFWWTPFSISSFVNYGLQRNQQNFPYLHFGRLLDDIWKLYYSKVFLTYVVLYLPTAKKKLLQQKNFNTLPVVGEHDHIETTRDTQTREKHISYHILTGHVFHSIAFRTFTCKCYVMFELTFWNIGPNVGHEKYEDNILFLSHDLMNCSKTHLKYKKMTILHGGSLAACFKVNVFTGMH